MRLTLVCDRNGEILAAAVQRIVVGDEEFECEIEASPPSELGDNTPSWRNYTVDAPGEMRSMNGGELTYALRGLVDSKRLEIGEDEVRLVEKGSDQPQR